MMTNYTMKRFTGSIACRDCVNKNVSTSEDKLVVLTTGFLFFDTISPQYLPEPKPVIEVGKFFSVFFISTNSYRAKIVLKLLSSIKGKIFALLPCSSFIIRKGISTVFGICRD